MHWNHGAHHVELIESSYIKKAQPAKAHVNVREAVKRGNAAEEDNHTARSQKGTKGMAEESIQITPKAEQRASRIYA